MRQAREAQSSRTEPWEGGGSIDQDEAAEMTMPFAVCAIVELLLFVAVSKTRLSSSLTSENDMNVRPVHKGVHFANLDVGGSGSYVKASQVRDGGGV